MHACSFRYLCVMFLFFILGLVALRLVTFVALWFFGFDFWILPNLFNEEAGVLESFQPFYSVSE
jgi:translocation protein SEC62